VGASRRLGQAAACPRFLAQGPQRLRAQGWGLKMLSAERLERILGCPCGWRGGPVRCEAPTRNGAQPEALPQWCSSRCQDREHRQGPGAGQPLPGPGPQCPGSAAMACGEKALFRSVTLHEIRMTTDGASAALLKLRARLASATGSFVTSPTASVQRVDDGAIHIGGDDRRQPCQVHRVGGGDLQARFAGVGPGDGDRPVQVRRRGVGG
jgi:hypothetical protein